MPFRDPTEGRRAQRWVIPVQAGRWFELSVVIRAVVLFIINERAIEAEPEVNLLISLHPFIQASSHLI